MIVGGALIQGSFTPTECAPHIKDTVCSRDEDLSKLKKFAETIGILGLDKMDKIDKATLVNEIKSALNVDSESAIYQSSTFRSFIGPKAATTILETRFNPPGPWNSDALLNNLNIDDKQEQWAQVAPTLYKKKYKNIPFQMIDFNHPISIMKSRFATIDICSTSDKYDCLGVVFNTDIRSGPGKHWFCLYFDFNGGTKEEPYKLEYFNSSGNPPPREILDWLEMKQSELLRCGKHSVILRAATEQLQKSDTECGVWSLMYLQYRLEGKSPYHFVEKNATDEDMLKFRQTLFRHS